ncbi:hypothetical protein [Pectobacterium brasiliense]|uniref:hypothetical protein n=1 Tax=Pectobacterium brasiliense TaxID=180957 RepID=UPI00196916F0|nr:hypothetical protein [Pectobacterium brasiliense]MBN3160188.1 hypothetical protein [Pectobacterium brasiliense]
MEINYSEKFKYKFNHGNNNAYDFDEMLNNVLIFIHLGRSLTFKEVQDNIYIQNLISFAMSMNWRKRHTQFNFIKMLACLPESVSLDILKTTHEMCLITKRKCFDDKEKSDWCNVVITYIGRVDRSKTGSDLKILSFKIMEIFNQKINDPC